VAVSIMLFQIDLGVTAGAITLPAALAAGGLLLALQMYRRGGQLPQSALIPIVMLLSVYGSVLTFGLPVLQQARRTAAVGRWIREHSAAGTPVGIVGLEKWRASLRYYADRPLTPLGEVEDVTAFFAQQPRAYVLMLRRDYRALRSRGVGVHAVGSQSMVVGNSGKYIRRQLWDRIVVVRATAPEFALVEPADGETRDLTAR
jgi:hypothetical protein